ncbi:hypothetical protein [Gemmata obscuriglobus]|uniref:Uncharacterized protein n=1 Tax=Gemmata obscuriglobus TaxID=114 RepID=A0A2Z3GU48_9BACT|nr:hypothetical protein [Gemmata obscuriglobus]AWM36071.1 hypothetical protein C1280_02965 [Gemmata obscuriglobus]
MQLFCPKCQAAHAGTQRCPRCGGLLLLPHETDAAVAPQPLEPAPEPPAPAPLGRVAVGAVFALGLYLGLRKFAMGVVLAAHPDPDALWNSFDGLLVVGGLQIATVIFGAVLAAAGRRGGFVFGATVGAVCGALFLGAELVAGAPARDLVLYLQPLVLVAVGGVAGVFATRVWGAVPVLDMPVPEPHKLSSLRFAAATSNDSGRPTAWARVLVGAALMVASVACADQVRKQAQRYSEGALKVGTVGQARFITWQVAMLGLLGGAGLAGANTGAGPRHGLLAGGIAGVGVLGATAARGEALVPVAFWLDKLSLGELAPTEPAAVAGALVGVALAGLVGGWLGGSLFQPLAPEGMRGFRSGRD